MLSLSLVNTKEKYRGTKMKLRETRSESSFSLDLRAASSSHLVALCFKDLETFIVLIVRLCVYYLVLV